MIILNFMAWDLASRLWFTISAIFSLFYFGLSMGELVHIWYNHFHPSHDWGKTVARPKRDKTIWKTVRDSSLLKEIIIGFIILLLLVLVFPILHI